MEPLKKGDEVHIKSMGMYGKVIHAVPWSEGDPEEDQVYQVQITRYFGRADLERYDREAERNKQKAELQAKVDHLEVTWQKVEAALQQSGTVKSHLAVEFITAGNDLWTALGNAPFLKPLAEDPKK